MSSREALLISAFSSLSSAPGSDDMEYVFTRRLIFARRVDDVEVLAFVRAERDVARFAVLMACILLHNNRPAKNADGTQQIKPTVDQDISSLLLVPGEPDHLCTLLCTQFQGLTPPAGNDRRARRTGRARRLRPSPPPRGSPGAASCRRRCRA